MSNSNSSGCCSCNGGCCTSKEEKKKITIDFLYLDLSVCTRCQGAETNLDEAIKEVETVLKAAGAEIAVNRINIASKELAIKHQFLSSPTIRINGIDIDLNVRESNCTECGDLCGDSVDCRVWVHEGIEYNEPPKAMIINSILESVYSGKKLEHTEKVAYQLPENLNLFFDGLKKKEI